MLQLTEKQKKFVVEYLIDLNAVEAAYRAEFEWESFTGFYVYFLINPMSGAVFYVGKGKGKRASSHLLPSGGGKNILKELEIRKIRAFGYEPSVRIFTSGLDESNVFMIERMMIKALRECELTNISGGTVSSAEACKAEAEDMLARMKPYREWETGLTSRQRRSAVTADQPVINISTNPKEFKLPAKFELYYPLSATKAMMLLESESVHLHRNRSVSGQQAHLYNLHMAAHSFRQVYSNSTAELEAIRVELAALLSCF
jgi:Terminase small subunit